MKTEYTIGQVKPLLSTRIDKIRQRELDNYNKLKNKSQYQIQQGFTTWVSQIIKCCRGGYI